MAESDANADQVLTIRQVAAFIILVVVFVSILERIVHHLHHLTKRNKKYREMLVKTITELMVVGLIYLLVKLLSYLGALNALHYAAIDAADILVFLVVIFLIVQAIVIFVVLAYTNNLVDSVDLYSFDDLVALADEEDKKPLAWIFRSKARRGMQIKLLESVFCKVYGLPRLFSFPKYIMEIQEDQVIQLMELRVSHWVILVCLFLLYFTCTGEMQLDHGPYRVTKTNSDIATRQGTRVLVMGILSGTLHLFMLLLLFTIRGALVFLLRRAGQYLAHDAPNSELENNDGTLEEQIQQMRDVSDEVRALEPKKRHHIFGGELLYRAFALLTCKKVEHPNALDVRVPDFRLPTFSLARVQFLTQLYLILNGLYCAILCTSVVPSIDSSMTGFYVALCVVPIFLNMLIVAPRLIAEYSVVVGVWKIDGNVLAKTIDHFVQVAKLKRQLQVDVTKYLESHNMTVSDALAQKDEFVDVEECRRALKVCGISLTRHELNTLLYLECKSSGGRIKWSDLVSICTCAPEPTASNGGSKSLYHRVATPH